MAPDLSWVISAPIWDRDGSVLGVFCVDGWEIPRSNPDSEKALLGPRIMSWTERRESASLSFEYRHDSDGKAKD